ncbi:K(+)/H(+) antiporter [Tilletia horrida]|nr:K(+)/H(+) antiporter [Tilletia horrida]
MAMGDPGNKLRQDEHLSSRLAVKVNTAPAPPAPDAPPRTHTYSYSYLNGQARISSAPAPPAPVARVALRLPSSPSASSLSWTASTTRSHSESSGEQAGIITAAAATTPSGGDADEKKQDDIASATPILRSNAPFKAPVKAARSGPAGPAVHVSALRLIELTDRLSAVMKAANALVLESQRALDPLLGVFRNFAALHGLRVKEEKLAIVERDEYARTVQAQADRERAERTALITGPQRELLSGLSLL